MTTPLSPAVQKAIEEIDAQRNQVLALDDKAVLAEEFLLTELAQSFKGTVTIGHGFGAMQGVLVFLRDVNRVADVAPVLGWFAKRGHKLTGKPEDYEEIQRRTWNLGDIKLSAFFRNDGDGNGCRYVKVGEEMRPVYKLLCDDAEVEEVTT